MKYYFQNKILNLKMQFFYCYFHLLFRFVAISLSYSLGNIIVLNKSKIVQIVSLVLKASNSLEIYLSLGKYVKNE